MWKKMDWGSPVRMSDSQSFLKPSGLSERSWSFVVHLEMLILEIKPSGTFPGAPVTWSGEHDSASSGVMLGSSAFPCAGHTVFLDLAPGTGL